MCARFLDLKTKCVLASTQKPYIKSIIGGKNNSPEAAKVSGYAKKKMELSLLPSSTLPSAFIFLPFSDQIMAFTEVIFYDQVDFSHGFIVEFETEEDRKYYLEKDEAHLKFAKGLAVAVQEVGILDFEPGVY